MKFFILSAAILCLTFASPYHHSNHHVAGPYRKEQSAVASTFEGRNAYVGAKSEIVSGYGNVYGNHGINRNGLVPEPIPYSSIIDDDRIHFKSENHPQLKPEFEAYHPHGAVHSNIEAHSENYLDYLKRIGDHHAASEAHERQYNVAHAAHYGHAHGLDAQFTRKTNLALSQEQINAVASIGHKTAATATNNPVVANHKSYEANQANSNAAFASSSNSGQGYSANQRTEQVAQTHQDHDAHGRTEESLAYIQHGPTSNAAYVSSYNNGYIKNNQQTTQNNQANIAYTNEGTIVKAQLHQINAQTEDLPLFGASVISENGSPGKHQIIAEQINVAQSTEGDAKSNVAYVSSNAAKVGYAQAGVFQRVVPQNFRMENNNEAHASINQGNMQYVSTVNEAKVSAQKVSEENHVAAAANEGAKANIAYVSSTNGAQTGYAHAGLFQGVYPQQNPVGIEPHAYTKDGQYIANNEQTSHIELDSVSQYQPQINHASVKYVNNFAQAENQAAFLNEMKLGHQIKTEVIAESGTPVMSNPSPIVRTPYYNQAYVAEENVLASASSAQVVSPQYIGGAYSNYAKASSHNTNAYENSGTQFIHDAYGVHDARDYTNSETVGRFASSQKNLKESAQHHQYSGVFGGLGGASSRTMTQAGMREYIYKRATKDLKLDSKITQSITTESKKKVNN